MTGWLGVGAASRGEGKGGGAKSVPSAPRGPLGIPATTWEGVRSRGKRPEALPIPRIQLREHSYMLAENLGVWKGE